jgi:hypothetical protein
MIITASGRWTVAQILTPILVAFSLGLAFILYILYKRGSLSRLFMRGVRRVRRQRDWEVDGGGSEFPHAPNAEATPMISQPHHWNSFFPRNTTDRRLSSRIREGMATPSITTAFRSIRRLFGRGPIRVSRVPMPEAFDIESSDSETDPFDTLRSNASKAKLLRPHANPKQTGTSGSDRAGSSYTLTNNSDGTRDSPLLDVDLDSDRVHDQGIANGVGGGSGTDDHDGSGDCVMLITRNGRDFSSGSTPRSLRSLTEVDQNSLEVVPPTPTQVSTSSNAMTHMKSLTISLLALPRGRLPYEKCVNTSSSHPFRLSPTTLVLPFNWRPVKPSTTSVLSFVSTVCFREPFAPNPRGQGRQSYVPLHGVETAQRPHGSRQGALPHIIPSHIAQPTYIPYRRCPLPYPLTTTPKLHAVVSRTVAPRLSICPAKFGAIEPDQRVRPPKLDSACGARCWL